MLARLVKNLRDTRGATFSMALLLLLVCTVVSAVVISAASISAGSMSDQGKADQRYYSVNSAVRLLYSYLGDDNKVTASSKQVHLGAAGNVTSSAVSDVEITGNEYNGFDDLFYELTMYALYGSDSLADAKQQLEAKAWNGWITEFESDYWTKQPGAKNSVEATLKVTPWMTSVGSGDREFNLEVEVEAKLTVGKMLYLEFRNVVDESKAVTDRYSVLVTMQASVPTVPTVEPAEGAEDGQSLTKTITWGVVSIEPGGRLPSV